MPSKRKSTAKHASGGDQNHRTPMNAFLRLGLPLVLLLIFAVVAVFVLNAFEATERMQTEKRAGPTILNR